MRKRLFSYEDLAEVLELVDNELYSDAGEAFRRVQTFTCAFEDEMEQNLQKAEAEVIRTIKRAISNSVGNTMDTYIKRKPLKVPADLLVHTNIGDSSDGCVEVYTHVTIFTGRMLRGGQYISNAKDFLGLLKDIKIMTFDSFPDISLSRSDDPRQLPSQRPPYTDAIQATYKTTMPKEMIPPVYSSLKEGLKTFLC